MRQPLSLIKLETRRNLSGSYGVLILALVISHAFMLLPYVLVPQESSLMLALGIEIIINLIAATLDAGFFRVCLMASRGSRPQFNDILFAFSAHPDTPVLIRLVEMLAMLLVSLPFMAYFLLVYFARAGWFEYALIAIWVVLLFLVTLLFIPAYYFYADHPEISSGEAIRSGIGLIRTDIPKYLLLILSFAGIFLLGVLSLGIGLLWALPYAATTLCHYFDIASADNENSGGTQNVRPPEDQTL